VTFEIGAPMTRENEQLILERKLVVVFDICSSTSILEDLKQTDNLQIWRNVLIALKENLLAESAKLNMRLYKFIGDGWILLLPDDVSRDMLFDLLISLSALFDADFDSMIRPLLQRQPAPVGLTFGIDAGELVRLEMNNQMEYLGRAINVASRLQSAAKELAGGCWYKALFAKHVFNSLPPASAACRDPRAKEVRLSLRNLSNNVECDFIEFRVL
jgi:class 3 adenylate cyclase